MGAGADGFLSLLELAGTANVEVGAMRFLVTVVDESESAGWEAVRRKFWRKSCSMRDVSSDSFPLYLFRITGVNSPLGAGSSGLGGRTVLCALNFLLETDS